MARPLWTGHISFGLVEIPVGLVSATRRDDLSFRQIDERDHAPVGYKRVNKRTGEEVPYEHIVKGYELDDGRMVLITKEELKEIHPKATSTIDIFAFVDGEEIDHSYYDSPYFLVPGGKKRKPKAYALLRETLRASGKVALAKVVLRTRQYVAALSAEGDALVLQTLRFPYELRDAADLELPGRDLEALGVTDPERKLADVLVDNLAAEFDPSAWQDDYRQAVLAYVEKKAEAGEVAAREEVAEAAGEARGDVVDIMELLKRSVEEAGGKKKKSKKAG